MTKKRNYPKHRKPAHIGPFRTGYGRLRKDYKALVERQLNGED